MRTSTIAFLLCAAAIGTAGGVPRSALSNLRETVPPAIDSLPPEFHAIAQHYLARGDEGTLRTMAEMADAYVQEARLPPESDDDYRADDLRYFLDGTKGLESNAYLATRILERLVALELALQPMLRADPWTARPRFAALRKGLETGEIEQELLRAFGDKDIHRAGLGEDAAPPAVALTLAELGVRAPALPKEARLARPRPPQSSAAEKVPSAPARLNEQILSIHPRVDPAWKARDALLRLNLAIWDHADDYPPTTSELLGLAEKLAEFAEAWDGPVLYPERPAMSQASTVIANALVAGRTSPAERGRAAELAARFQRVLDRR